MCVKKLDFQVESFDFRSESYKGGCWRENEWLLLAIQQHGCFK